MKWYWYPIYFFMIIGFITSCRIFYVGFVVMHKDKWRQIRWQMKRLRSDPEDAIAKTEEPPDWFE